MARRSHSSETLGGSIGSDARQYVLDHINSMTNAKSRAIIAIGDIHGQATKLRRLLGKIGPFKNKTLVFLGDYLDPRGDAVLDEGPATIDALSELFGCQSPHIYYLEGDCDRRFIKFLRTSMTGEGIDPAWIDRGGKATLRAYLGIEPDLRAINPAGCIPSMHRKFFTTHVHQTRVLAPGGSGCIVRGQHISFVHAGGCRSENLVNTAAVHPQITSGDSSLVLEELCSSRGLEQNKLWAHGMIVVGHAPTQLIAGTSKPIIGERMIALDTGAGFGGPLTAMEFPSLEYWQSE